ncbi:hypothetical protein D3C76_1564810 [compost metagenome]
MDIHLPLDGNYKLNGAVAFGDIRSSIPAFTIYNKKIMGTVGEGDYYIHVDGNGDLDVYSF